MLLYRGYSVAATAARRPSARFGIYADGKPEQSTKVNLNAADAETLRRDLFGIG